MKKRLFVAIDVSDDIKEKLLKTQKKFKNLRVRWTKKENLHFTLLFIGWVDEEKIGVIKNSIENAVSDFSFFILKLDRIVLGPDEKRARMIWAEGLVPPELQKLRKRLIEELAKNKISFDNRHSFRLHITLARAKGKELRGIKIKEEINLAFSVKEVLLMESVLHQEGPEYKVLSAIKLKP